MFSNFRLKQKQQQQEQQKHTERKKKHLKITKFKYESAVSK